MPVDRAADGDALFLALRIYNFKPAKVEWQSALLAHTHQLDSPSVRYVRDETLLTKQLDKNVSININIFTFPGV